MNSEKSFEVFVKSAGGLLFAFASALFLANLTSRNLRLPHEPLLEVSIPVFFWIVGGIALFIALYCLFWKHNWLHFAIVLWLAVNLGIYGISLPLLGVTGGFKGYLLSVSDVLGLSCRTVNLLLAVMVVYLAFGSVVCLIWNRMVVQRERANPSLKMPCPSCGGHIRFSIRNLGQAAPCPHCQRSVTLRKSEETLKMSCFFCKGHIEFPAHAVGEQLKCPHCKMDITLKEPA